MKIPKRNQIPEKGFYYHYKHNPAKGVRDYAYEMIGVGVHTEDDCRPEDATMVIYRPLYEDARIFKVGKGKGKEEKKGTERKLFYIRPLEMWAEKVSKEGKNFPPIYRFQKIIDPVLIKELETIKTKMYEV